MSGARCNTYNHNHNKAKKAKYEAKVSGRALWVPWPNPAQNHQSKPCQILWMVLGREQQRAGGAGHVRAEHRVTVATQPPQTLPATQAAAWQRTQPQQSCSVDSQDAQDSQDSKDSQDSQIP